MANHTNVFSDIILRSIKRFLGFVFLLSANSKILSLNSTSLIISEYLPLIPKELLFVLIILLSCIEYIIAIGLILQMHSRYTLLSMVILVLLLSLFVGIDIGRLIIHDIGSCGCFGPINIFSSPPNSLIRDLSLLFLLSIVLYYSAKKLFFKTYQLFIPFISIGAVIFFIANNIIAVYNDLSVLSNVVDNDWYGIQITEVNNCSAEEIINTYFPSDVNINYYGTDNPYYKISSSRSNIDIDYGYLSMMLIPLPKAGSEYFKIATIYDSNICIKDILLEPPSILKYINWPSKDTLENFISRIINYDDFTVIPFEDEFINNIKPIIIGDIIISLLNNITMHLLNNADSIILEKWR